MQSTMETEANMDKIVDGQQVVTSLGNAWVISRSKSYSGRIYYFNTLTGEAVWNLSKEEIEKAKKRTAKLPLHLENFPEPQGPPGDHSNHDSNPNTTQNPEISQFTPPKDYNKQIISNQFTRPQYTPFVTPCHNCTPMNSVQSMVGIRPNMWIQPPPIFFATPSTSMTNIKQTENISQHNCFNQDFTVQNTSVSLSRRFSFANSRTRGKIFSSHLHGVGKFTPRNNKFNSRKPFVPRRMQNQNQVSDLRTIITAKKSVNEISKGGQENDTNTVQEPVNLINTSLESLGTAPHPDSKKVEDDLFINADDEWLKNNGTIDGAKLKLDVTILKNLATENSDCECWYIVVDKNVLMKHFNFLNVLTSSDEQCKLMIVRDVMSQLQAAARSDVTKDGARKVLRSLSQLFAARIAVIAEYSFKPNEIKDCIGMVNFCLMLQQQNEHVVLLSNEEALKKHTSKVPTFTIQDVKELLTSDKDKVIQIISPAVERNIKITIPNDIQTFKHSKSDDDEETNKLAAGNVSLKECSPKTLSAELNTKETDVQTDNVISIASKMVDAEVQTDPSLELTQPTTRKDSIGINTVENISNIDRETNIDNSINPENNKIINEGNDTREIRLKRSISNQTTKSNSNDADKKHSKWYRKRRDGSVGFSDSNSSLDDRVSRMSSNFLEINSNAPQIPYLQDTVCQPRSQSTNMNYYDFCEGSETSSCVFMPREFRENILIEETSTSDGISNSVSNVDSESMQEINKVKEKSRLRNYEVQSKNVMFEITSKEMEQNLKMRRDEWLAEFIQIMEEVLTQICRKSEHIVKTMPPPWTLHEATECIRRIFISDSDVIDAATKLSQVIYRMSDNKGKIQINFNPNEFMELYSYGVYLVDSLQTILEKCEDLQIAAESLTKLLSHIENPSAEGGHNDSFGDNTGVSVIISQSSTEATSNQESDSVVSNKSTASQGIKKHVDAHSNQSVGKYNLRSSRKTKPSEENGETPAVKFIRKINIHDDFFKSLHLLRKEETDKDIAKVVENNPVLQHNSNEDCTSNEDKPADKEPNIIRNFSRCPEFEEKFKKQSREPLDMDVLDYSMSYNDYAYDNIHETYLDDDYGHDHEYIDERDEEFPNNISSSAEKPTVDPNNNYFKIHVNSLMDTMKETTANVYIFCKKTHGEIQSENMHSDRRIEIHDKAQKAMAHIQNICNSFRRIQEGNMNQNSDGIQYRLKEAGILLSDAEVSLYRDVICSCIEHGDTLLESINIIIDALKT